MPTPSSSAAPLPTELLASIDAQLGYPPSSSQPLAILTSHLSALPPELLAQVGSHTTARERAKIPEVKARRLAYASRNPIPAELSAGEGRRRWPLMWERMGGDPRPSLSTRGQEDAAHWAKEEFMGGQRGFVGRLAQALAEEEEVREWDETRVARGRERRLDEEGEEFDDESDEEMETSPAARPPGTGVDDQEGVERAFEKRLLEIFVDGLDTVEYDEIDFAEPDDSVAARDRLDAWFDDEPPSDAKALAGNGVGHGEKSMENGQGEYDY